MAFCYGSDALPGLLDPEDPYQEGLYAKASSPSELMIMPLVMRATPAVIPVSSARASFLFLSFLAYFCVKDKMTPFQKSSALPEVSRTFCESLSSIGMI